MRVQVRIRSSVTLILAVACFSLNVFSTSQTLLANATISGVIFAGASSGHPLPDARVQLQDTADGSIVDETTSAANGSFAFTGLSAGQYRLYPVKPGYSFTGDAAKGSVIVALPRNGEYHIKLFMTSSASISGFVTTSEAAPLANARVVILSPNAAGPVITRQQTITDSRGRFNFAEVPPGYYALVAANNPVPGTAPLPPIYFPPQSETDQLRFFQLKPGQHYGDIALGAPIFERRNITGVVTNVSDSGSANSMAVAMVPSQGLRIPITTVMSDSAGRFIIQSAPTGDYELFAWGPIASLGPIGPLPSDRYRVGRVRIDSQIGDVNDIEIPLQEDSTYTVDIKTPPGDVAAKDCLSHALLRLTPLDALPFYRELRSSPRSDHQVIFQNVPAGRYGLSLDGDSSRACDITARGRPLSAISVDGSGHLEATVTGLTGEASGVVVDHNASQAIPNAWILAVPEGSSAEISYTAIVTTFSDNLGRFRFTNLRPGKYKMIAKAQLDWSECLDPLTWKDALSHEVSQEPEREPQYSLRLSIQ